MHTGEQVLTSRPDAPWLPAGGRADVVLAATDAPVPDPVCIVRLLTTYADEAGPRLHVVSRSDGGGPDLPTRLVADGSPEACLAALAADTWGHHLPVRLLGYVRNVVTPPVDDYAWPVPHAHFAVWHAELASPAHPGSGVWLSADEAREVLADRHWWPLAALLLDGDEFPAASASYPSSRHDEPGHG